MENRLQKRPRGENDRLRAIFDVPHHPNAGDARAFLSLFQHQPNGRFLSERQVFGVFQPVLQIEMVPRLVRLGSRPVHGRPLAAIEHAKLDSGRIDRLPHEAAKGVDLSHDLPLAHAADRRIAAHHADGIEVRRQQRRLRPHPRRRRGRFSSGVPGADDEDVEVVVGSLCGHVVGVGGRGIRHKALMLRQTSIFGLALQYHSGNCGGQPVCQPKIVTLTKH